MSTKLPFKLTCFQFSETFESDGNGSDIHEGRCELSRGRADMAPAELADGATAAFGAGLAGLRHRLAAPAVRGWLGRRVLAQGIRRPGPSARSSAHLVRGIRPLRRTRQPSLFRGPEPRRSYADRPR